MKTFIFYDNMMHLDNINKLNIPYVHTDGIFENIIKRYKYFLLYIVP